MLKRFAYLAYFTSLGLWLGGSLHLYRATAGDKDDDVYQQLEVFTRVLERVRKVRDDVSLDQLAEPIAGGRPLRTRNRVAG